MYLIVSHRKQADNSIKSYDGSSIIVSSGVVGLEPVICVFQIALQIARIRVNAKYQLQVVNRVIKENGQNCTSIVEIFENVCCVPVGVMVSVDKEHHKPSTYLQQEERRYHFPAWSIDLKKGQFAYQE